MISEKTIPLPTYVNTFCHAYEAWVVGGAATPNPSTAPKDYDIVVPFQLWHACTPSIPADAKRNSFGGFKFTPPGTDYEVDLWPGDVGWVLCRPKCKFAYHPLTGTLLEKSYATTSGARS